MNEETDKCIIVSQNLLIFLLLINSVQFSGSVLSNSLPPHGQQHARPPCPSPTRQALKTSRNPETPKLTWRILICFSILKHTHNSNIHWIFTCFRNYSRNFTYLINAHNKPISCLHYYPHSTVEIKPQIIWFAQVPSALKS